MLTRIETDTKTPQGTESVVEADRRYTWHPYTQHQTRAIPIEITRAAGAYLFTVDGRSIFDGISSWWVTTHGHTQPEIADAIAEQARTLEHTIFTHFTHEPAALFAQELVEVLPEGLGKIFYTDDGSTAVEAAIKMAIQFHANKGRPRSMIAAFSEAYHGDTFGAMSVSQRGLFTEPFHSKLFQVQTIPNPTQGDTVEAFAELLEKHGKDLAAVIVEPLLMGTAGMLMYSEEILAELRKMAKAHNVLFIADEVLTGFGRTGPLFACNRADITPDIMCLSKGITGGFLPLGVTAATEEIFSEFLSEDKRRTLFHGHSYTANPIACAAARASLKLLNDDSEAQRKLINEVHQKHLKSLSSNPRIAQTRVLGTVAAFDLVSTFNESDGGGASYLDPIGAQLAAFALDRDILLRPLGNVIYILPPYCSTEEDLNQVYSVIEQFLNSH